MSLLAPSTLPTLETLMKSGALPNSQKTSILAAYQRMLDNGTLAKSKAAGISLAEGVPVVGAAGMVGAALGAAHCMLPGGLDVKIPGTTHTVPLDGIGAVLGLIGGAGAAYDGMPGIGRVIQGGAATCMGIYSFRKVHDLLTNMKARKSGITPGGGASAAGLQKIGKSSFAGEGDFGAEGGWAPGSNVPQRSWNPFGSEGDFGEDPIVKAARNL